jgi:hypothetical protein
MPIRLSLIDVINMRRSMRLPPRRRVGIGVIVSQD